MSTKVKQNLSRTNLLVFRWKNSNFSGSNLPELVLFALKFDTQWIDFDVASMKVRRIEMRLSTGHF